MSTTIRVNESTVQMLMELKQRMELDSFNEVITELITFRKKKISLFGADPELKKWDENEDRAEFREY